jgi:cell division protein FtsZ
MREAVDSLIVIQNEKLLTQIEKKTSLKEDFLKADDILRQGVQGISDLILKVGIINVDFADVKSTMYEQGDALMGIGVAEGSGRAEEAALRAMENPLLEDITIEGAQRILVNVSGGDNFALSEMAEVVNIITEKADPEVQIISGAALDPELGDKLKVALIATGFQPKTIPMAEISSGAEKMPEKEKEVISIAEWDRISTGGTRARPGLSPRKNFNQDDLDIPAVLRCSPSYPLRSADSPQVRPERFAIDL